MLEYTRLKANQKRSTDGFASVRLAVLCNYSSQHLAIALKGTAVDSKLKLDVYEADYAQIEQQVFEQGSELYAFAPEFVLVSFSSHHLLDEFYATPLDQRIRFAEAKLRHIKSLFSALQSRSNAAVLLTNFVELNDAVFGSYASNTTSSFPYQIKKLNLWLMEEAQERKGLFIVDAQSLASIAGTASATDQKSLLKADMAWSLGFLPSLAKTAVGLIEAVRGAIKKCLVLDLDNTLWGGVIGDDGLAGIELGDFGNGRAFSRFQKWIKELKRRGIIVCVCSKNTEAVAKEVFEKHPDSVLKPEDIAVFAVNWNNKVDNLHFIRNTLNIGFDAMVFVDDNPFERGMVKEAIPELEVPEMPEDPVEYLPYLQSLNLFETVSYTQEDENRTLLYKQEAERTAYQAVYQNEGEYLASLKMNAEIKPLDSFTIPRAAQLSQRSNQFNLRTVRYAESELSEMASSTDYFPFAVSLQDKFGDYGIISFVVLKKNGNELFIENWMMSCRVLKRGVEQAVLNEVVSIAKEHGTETVVAEYLPTAKNALVKDHYKNLGFTSVDGLWHLPVGRFTKRQTAITVSANKLEKLIAE